MLTTNEIYKHKTISKEFIKGKNSKLTKAGENKVREALCCIINNPKMCITGLSFSFQIGQGMVDEVRLTSKEQTDEVNLIVNSNFLKQELDVIGFFEKEI